MQDEDCFKGSEGNALKKAQKKAGERKGYPPLRNRTASRS